MRTSDVNRSLERTISAARLSRYLRARADNLDAAIELYERNTRLAEALYTTLQGLEVTLRNTIDSHMRVTYGDDWLISGAAPLQAAAVEAVEETSGRIRSSKHDDLVAELKFSFWVGLLGHKYDDNTWRAAIHLGFRATGPKQRKLVHRRMNALRRFRNRVAHHEPIYDRAAQMHAEAIEAIGWMCADTSRWVAHCSRFDEVHG